MTSSPLKCKDALATGRWLMRVPLYEDEAISSWLVRSALQQGCDPLTLTGVVWPKWRVWTIDVDRGLPIERVEVLTQLSGVSAESFLNAGLRPVVEQITSANLDRLRRWPWILVLGSRNRTHRGGWQYCPDCLTDDVKPYMRKKWRFAWHVGCSIHKLLLRDFCPCCGAAIQPNRVEALDQNIASCAICKYDLRFGDRIPVSEVALKLQSDADYIIQTGEGFYDGEKLSSQEWFLIAQHFSHLARKVLGEKNQGLLAFCESLALDTSKLRQPATGLALEFLPTSEREMLLGLVHQLFHVSRVRFVETAKELKMSQSSFWDTRNALPSILSNLISQLSASNRSYRVNRIVVDPSRPKSRSTVEHKFARLQRKLRDKM